MQVVDTQDYVELWRPSSVPLPAPLVKALDFDAWCVVAQYRQGSRRLAPVRAPAFAAVEARRRALAPAPAPAPVAELAPEEVERRLRRTEAYLHPVLEEELQKIRSAKKGARDATTHRAIKNIGSALKRCALFIPCEQYSRQITPELLQQIRAALQASGLDKDKDWKDDRKIVSCYEDGYDFQTVALKDQVVESPLLEDSPASPASSSPEASGAATVQQWELNTEDDGENQMNAGQLLYSVLKNDIFYCKDQWFMRAAGEDFDMIFEPATTEQLTTQIVLLIQKHKLRKQKGNKRVLYPQDASNLSTLAKQLQVRCVADGRTAHTLPADAVFVDGIMRDDLYLTADNHLLSFDRSQGLVHVEAVPAGAASSAVHLSCIPTSTPEGRLLRWEQLAAQAPLRRFFALFAVDEARTRRLLYHCGRSLARRLFFDSTNSGSLVVWSGATGSGKTSLHDIVELVRGGLGLKYKTQFRTSSQVVSSCMLDARQRFAGSVIYTTQNLWIDDVTFDQSTVETLLNLVNMEHTYDVKGKSARRAVSSPTAFILSNNPPPIEGNAEALARRFSLFNFTGRVDQDARDYWYKRFETEAQLRADFEAVTICEYFRQLQQGIVHTSDDDLLQLQVDEQEPVKAWLRLFCEHAPEPILTEHALKASLLASELLEEWQLKKLREKVQSVFGTGVVVAQRGRHARYLLQFNTLHRKLQEELKQRRLEEPLLRLSELASELDVLPASPAALPEVAPAAPVAPVALPAAPAAPAAPVALPEVEPAVLDEEAAFRERMRSVWEPSTMQEHLQEPASFTLTAQETREQAARRRAAEREAEKAKKAAEKAALKAARDAERERIRAEKAEAAAAKKAQREAEKAEREAQKAERDAAKKATKKTAPTADDVELLLQQVRPVQLPVVELGPGDRIYGESARLIPIDFEYSTEDDEIKDLICCCFLNGDNFERFWLPEDRERLRTRLQELQQCTFCAHAIEKAEAKAFLKLDLRPQDFQWVDTWICAKLLANKTRPANASPLEEDDDEDFFEPVEKLDLASVTERYTGRRRDCEQKHLLQQICAHATPEQRERIKDSILNYCCEDCADVVQIVSSMNARFLQYDVKSIFAPASASPASRGFLQIARLLSHYAAVVAVVSARGLPVDAEAVERLRAEAPLRAAQVKEDFRKATGLEVTKRAQIFEKVKEEAERLQLPAPEDTKKATLKKLFGNRSEFVLQYLHAADEVRMFGSLQHWCEHLREGRMQYGCLNIFRAFTGRAQPSSSRGFIPTWDKRFHHLMKAPAGKMLVELDYCAEELFLAGALYKDRALLDAYAQGGDIYQSILCALGKATQEDAMLTKEAFEQKHPGLRKVYKTSILGEQYGMGAATLAARLDCDYDDAQAILQQLRRTFAAKTREAGAIVERMYTPGRESLNMLPSGWACVATTKQHDRFTTLRNFPIQASGAAILCKLIDRLVTCYETPERRLVATVHDAILLELPEGDEEGVREAQRAMIETVAQYVRACEGFYDVKIRVERTDLKGDE